MIIDTDPDARNVLTQTEAQHRATQISDVEYELSLGLQADAREYEGEVRIGFRHARPAEETFLDFTGKAILHLEVNGTVVTDAVWSGHRLTLPPSLLREQNSVQVRYRNAYDHSGAGFHQFTDPEDSLEYLYTQFEPFEAHRLLPCFDQPDIKATYRLDVTAPEAWQVITNDAAERTEETSDGRRRHMFAQTPRFSTYLLAVVAGPFRRFEDQHGEIPLAIYCRESWAPYFDPEEFFTITKQGLSFYEEFFDVPYPFAKYDQVLVPEFNFGAMENVGCVTFSERMIFRDPPTDLQRLNRAEVILHEMAHMWFGDLVTMRWWNDLWLNESFATYMSYFAMHEATRFQDGAWPAFHARMKAWAYQQDQLATTHPISGAVPDTDATFLNFDGITYGKGASVLKQLVAVVGPDGFRNGMRHYFKTHAWGNTTLADFLGALEHGAERDLQAWSQEWLEIAGVNTLAPVWTVKDGTVARFSVEQSAPPTHETLRSHRLDLALFDAEAGGGVRQREPEALEVAGPRTVVESLVGAEAPAAVYPNHGDHAYAKIALDPSSLAFVQDRLERFDDPFQRLLLWHTLWDMVRDQGFRSTDYLALARAKLPHESSMEITATVLGNVATALARYVPEEQRPAETAAAFDFCWERLYAVDSQDGRIVWARALIGAAQEPERIARVWALVDAGTGLEGFTLDQDMRWSLAVKAVAYGLDGAVRRLSAERERDKSDRGARATESAGAAGPDPEGKAAAWRRFHEDRGTSLHMIRSAMGGFFWPHQHPALDPYVTEFFAQVRDIFRTRDKDFASSYFGALFPHHLPRENVITQSRALLEALAEDEALLRRMLREGLDELERAVACRQFAIS